MKRHWKKILTVFISLLLVIGGYIIYIFQFKEYDVADTEVTEITRETYTIELPGGETIVLDESGNIVESEKEATGTDNEDGSSIVGSNNNDGETSSESSVNTPGETSGNTSDNPDTEGKGSSGGKSGSDVPTTSTPTEKEVVTITVASIKEKYNPTMISLQDQANSRIDALVGRAIQEYQTKKANGETVNYAYFYNKYTSAAAELEGRTDKVFNQVVGVIEKELEANGYSKTHVKTLVNDYEAAKEARRSALLDKAINR